MKREEFDALYRECLVEAINAKPTDYGYPVEGAPLVAGRMMIALDQNNANTTGSAWGRLARRLGIKHTNRAIFEFRKTCT